MTKKLYIKTFGCQMNEYDSARLVTTLCASCDMETVSSPDEADLILLNTCSVREKAQEKLFSDLGRLKHLKKINPQLVIGVGGCVASQEKENIIKRAPYVELVFGPQVLHKVPEMYEAILATRKSAVDVEFLQIEKFAHLPESQLIGPSAFVTIMEGCNKYCSYCIVPYTRGKEVSRSFDEIMLEVKCLVKQGAREITFLGQNVNDYKSIKNNGDHADLAELLYAAAEFESICRLRFVTSYPSSLSDRLIKAFAEIPKLVDHLHIPVQSGSDRILKAMRRLYTVEEFKNRIARLQQVRPNISLSSDFIVGFPGETDEDFMQTLDLVKEINFDASFSFIYSPRPGTMAAKMADNISLESKKERLRILQQQLNLQAANYSNAMLGTVQKVLVTSLSRKDSKQFCGRTENNRIVNIKTLSKNIAIGQLLDVELATALRNCLIGKL